MALPPAPERLTLVVVLARLVSSLGFGVLWASTSRAPALLTVALLLTCAIPTAAWLLRALRTAS